MHMVKKRPDLDEYFSFNFASHRKCLLVHKGVGNGAAVLDTLVHRVNCHLFTCQRSHLHSKAL